MSTLVEQLRDPDSDFYDPRKTFMKKDHLTHAELLDYQQLSSTEISSLVAKLGVQAASQLVWLMLQSYMIVTRAANAGWKFVKAFDDEGARGTSDALGELRRALHDYSPQNFAPHVADIEFAADCFEKFYDEASRTTKTREEMEELLFTWTERLHADAKSRRVPRVTYEDVMAKYLHQRGKAP